MTHNFNLTLIQADTDEAFTVSGKLTDEAWVRLEDYVRYVDRLLDTKLVRDRMRTSLSIHWEENSTMRFFPALPPSEEIEAFLLRLRRIHLQGESTNFFKICNILGKVLANSTLRALIGMQRDLFRGAFVPVKIQKTDGTAVNWDAVLNTWLNAEEYHTNKAERERLKQYDAIFPFESTKVLLISLLSDKVVAARNISKLTQVVLGKIEHTKFDLQDTSFILTNLVNTED